MPRFAVFVRSLPLAVASVVLVTAAAPPAFAQTSGASQAPAPRIDDSPANGIIIGAALGTVGGFVWANVLDDRCGNELCNRPTLHTYLLGVGVGAGAGIGVGWLIDKLHKGKGPAPVAVAIRADHEARAVRVQWRF